MKKSDSGDLGFTYAANKRGDIQIYHNGRLATTLRDLVADEFLTEIESASPEDIQQLLARLTGNYKRGNERTAKNHPRNRKQQAKPKMLISYSNFN